MAISYTLHLLNEASTEKIMTVSCDLQAAGRWKWFLGSVWSSEHTCKTFRVQEWLQVTVGDVGNHWGRSTRQGSLRESGLNIWSQSSPRRYCHRFQDCWFFFCSFIYRLQTNTSRHKHEHTVLDLTCAEWQTDLSGNWQMVRQSPPWEFHLGVVGGDDWKDTEAPNDLWTLIVFFLIHYTHIPTMGCTCSAYTHSNARRQSWVPNLWHICPKRHAKNKHRSCEYTW